MGSIIGEERHLENVDNSLLTPSPKYKRHKVSVVRDFPRGYGQKDAPLFKQTKAKGVQGVGDLNGDGVLKEVLIDIENCGEPGGDLCEAERKGNLEKTVEFKTSNLALCGKAEYKNDELKSFSVKNHNTLEEIKILGEKRILANEIHDSSNDLIEVMLQFQTTLKDSSVVANNSCGEEGASVKHRSLPHHPIPSNPVLKEQKYPLPRRVSAIRDFPGGSGFNDEIKIQGVGSRKSDSTHEQPSEADEGVSVKINMEAPMLGQSYKFMEQEKKFADNNVEQSGYGGKDETDAECLLERLQNNIMVYVKDKNKKKRSVGVSTSNIEFQKGATSEIDIETDVAIVEGLMCAKSSPSCVSAKQSKGKTFDYDVQDKTNHSLTKRKDKEDESMLIVPYNKESTQSEEHNDFQILPRSNDCVFSPHSSIVGSSERDARSKVRKTVKLFQALFRSKLQEEETKPKQKGAGKNRPDIAAANQMKEKGLYINTEKVVGAIPGVEIGDCFTYRMELAVIGVHSPLQSGIDTIRRGKQYIAISVVASGGYDNDIDSSDVVIYTGQGGNPTGIDKQPEDQKLERGNLALKNCIDEKIHVRVIRGFKEAKPAENGDKKPKMITTYTYDGLYTVDKYWQELGIHEKLVYKFELRRIPGQRQLTWKEMKQSKKSKIRKGCCVDDISEGKDKPPICAINTIDDDKPPKFTYITSMVYPDWCRPILLTGCDCKNGCSDSDRCACAVKNGGEIPYNLNGAIVRAKPLVYECGPSCSCSPSCPNRVSQRGIKLPLEVFKTESRGWGVRCLSYISSGSFICEYIGELLDDKQAEQRVGGDEYLFDIGQNYNDTTLWDGLSALMPDMPSVASDVVENIGFTIDAAKYGNIGRFINHSCTPNLYAQNVLYDHGDKRIPHIMLFAFENIPPLEELTYHYNYKIDQVLDSEGNIKRKNCYCGSVECTGRMY